MSKLGDMTSSSGTEVILYENVADFESFSINIHIYASSNNYTHIDI